MARGAVTSIESNFTRGLITEFTAMNFPENAVTECDNVVFSELGEVYRRPGIAQEFGGIEHPVNSGPLGNPGTVVEFRWASVGNNGTVSFIVQQLGRRLSFFKTGQDAAVSDGLLSDSIDLSTFAVSGATAAQLNQPCQFTSGKGFLFVAHPFCDPFAVAYDSENDEVTPTRIRIEIRDLQGVDDGLDIDERPTTLSALHEYNLLNQGWYAEAKVDNAADGQVLAAWEEVRDDFPSNADIWWVYKNSQEIASFEDDPDDGFVGPMNFTLGNTPAPKGHYIYNAFNINRTNETGISGLETETSGLARPSCIAFYAGRVFYAGVAKDGYSDKIYFSQIIERNDQFGKCYQVADPTSETIFDLLDTDGGTLSLPLIEKVVSMRVVGDSLIVQGTNGHFAVRGSDNGPFRATNYTVEYVSSIGASSPLSIVEVDGGLTWINQDGLYALGKDQIGVSFAVQNLSKTTIQSLLRSIPPENVPFIKGCYNKKDQIVRWLFSLEDNAGYSYEKLLEFNVISKAFYVFTFSTRNRIVGMLSTYGSTLSVTSEEVFADALDPVDPPDPEPEDPIKFEPENYSTGGLGEGLPEDMPAAVGTMVPHDTFGEVFEASGIFQIYQREAVELIEGERYQVEGKLADTVSTTNVIFGIRWLNADYENVGSAYFYHPPGDNVGDNDVVEGVGFIGVGSGALPGDIIPPPSAVYFRPKFRTSGLGEPIYIVHLAGRQLPLPPDPEPEPEPEPDDHRVRVNGEVVTVDVEEFSPQTEVFKFGYLDDGFFSYAELNNLDYKDWELDSFVSYGISGHRVRGELLKPFNSSTLSFVFREAAGSKLILRGIWDYGARQSSYYQIYPERPLQSYVVRKLKFRGKGKSLQFRFESIDDAPFFIVGWSAFETAGTIP